MLLLIRETLSAVMIESNRRKRIEMRVGNMLGLRIRFVESISLLFIPPFSLHLVLPPPSHSYIPVSDHIFHRSSQAELTSLCFLCLIQVFRMYSARNLIQQRARQCARVQVQTGLRREYTFTDTLFTHENPSLIQVDLY